MQTKIKALDTFADYRLGGTLQAGQTAMTSETVAKELEKLGLAKILTSSKSEQKEDDDKDEPASLVSETEEKNIHVPENKMQSEMKRGRKSK